MGPALTIAVNSRNAPIPPRTISSSRVQSVIRSKLSYANVMATIAVFLALGAWAAINLPLPKGSVGTKQLRK